MDQQEVPSRPRGNVRQQALADQRDGCYGHDGSHGEAGYGAWNDGCNAGDDGCNARHDEYDWHAENRSHLHPYQDE